MGTGSNLGRRTRLTTDKRGNKTMGNKYDMNTVIHDMVSVPFQLTVRR